MRLLREYERFCGVRVLTFCILSNHFHLLVEVPARPAQPLSAGEVLARVEVLSSSPLTPKLFRRHHRQPGSVGGAGWRHPKTLGTAEVAAFLIQPLTDQLQRLRARHADDVRRGFAGVWLPNVQKPGMGVRSPLDLG